MCSGFARESLRAAGYFCVMPYDQYAQVHAYVGGALLPTGNDKIRRDGGGRVPSHLPGEKHDQ